MTDEQVQKLMEADLTLSQRLSALESEVAALTQNAQIALTSVQVRLAALVEEHQATRDRILSATSRLSAVEHQQETHDTQLTKLTHLVELHSKGA